MWRAQRNLLMLMSFGAVLFGSDSFAQISSANTAAKDFFVQKVHPLLQDKCFGCHGEDKENLEADFDMRTREGLLKGGESGMAALIPGKPDESPMFRAVLRTEKMKMPPKDKNKLSTEEIEILRQWILAGAVWENPPANATTQPKWDYKEEDIWAFRPIKRVSVPQIENQKSKIKNPIDAFIQEKLLSKNVKQSWPADKVTLLRRVTYDLTGLPPTAKELNDFTKDKSPDAFDKVIQRLLASSHYGEHWARHWLDVVRYADTDGYSNDYERPNAWRYRDYVIRSFNNDKPYDQFVAEQIAGDEIDPNDPEKLIAVGMLRMGPWEHTAMSVAAETRQLFLDDATSIIGAAYLGLTTGCAKCHDHKFDPIPTKDYYRLQSCFAPTQFEARKVDFLISESAPHFAKEIARLEASIKSVRTEMKTIRGKHDQAVAEFLKENNYKSLKDVPLAKRPKKDLGLTPIEQSLLKTLDKRADYRQRELQRYKPLAFSVSSGGLTNKIETPVLHVLIGGALGSAGEPVTPGVLSAVYNSDDAKDSTTWNTVPQTTENRRLQLAKWIASTNNPLTSRVMVNRIWQYHFGKGLVETPNNFGKMGKKPTHPELLDWLANYFMEHGWSVKEMHRLILRSAVYQQSSQHPDEVTLKQVDPEEKLYARFLPRRLTAEELRDSILAVSGELNLAMGGPPAFPQINLEAALQPRHIMGGMAPPYVPSPTRSERNRRTIYAVQIRTLIDPMQQVFNAAPSEFSCERRDATTVTPQVFALFNSQFSHDAALAMAARLSKNVKSSSRQIEQAFLLAYGRKPTAEEKKRCSQHVEHMLDHHRKTAPTNFEMPKEIVRSMVEEFTGEAYELKEEWDMSNYEYNLRSSDVSPEVRALADFCLVILNSNEFVYVY